MQLNPPPELRGCALDKKAASRSSLAPRLIGWLSFLILVSGVICVIFFPDKRSMLPLLFLIFFVLFLLYVILKFRRRTISCGRCGQPMAVLDVKWTPEQWKSVQGYDLIDGFRGADGSLYSTDIDRKGGIRPLCDSRPFAEMGGVPFLPDLLSESSIYAGDDIYIGA